MSEYIKISKLLVGKCNSVLTVKVDRKFNRYQMHYSTSYTRPVCEHQSVDVILFDTENSRMLLQLKTDEHIRRFAPMLSETGVYNISGFKVNAGGFGVHDYYHITFVASTMVGWSSALLPRRCLHLKNVSDLSGRISDEVRFYDVCGKLKSWNFVNPGRIVGVYQKELLLVLIDQVDLGSRPSNEVSIVLYGEPAAVTIAKMEILNVQAGEIVIVQHAVGRLYQNPGAPTITSLCDATRVLFHGEFM